jgi:hypothetical protein
MIGSPSDARDAARSPPTSNGRIVTFGQREGATAMLGSVASSEGGSSLATELSMSIG